MLPFLLPENKTQHPCAVWLLTCSEVDNEATDRGFWILCKFTEVKNCVVYILAGNTSGCFLKSKNVSVKAIVTPFGYVHSVYSILFISLSCLDKQNLVTKFAKCDHVYVTSWTLYAVLE